MTRRICGALIRLLATVIVALPVSATEDDAIWTAAEQLLLADVQAPMVPSPSPRLSGAHPYFYESFTQWSPEALRRAVALWVERTTPPTDPADQDAYSQELQQGIQKLLEYYPLVARTQGDFEQVRNWVFDPGQPAPLRIYLLEQATPDTKPRSGFAAYYQGHLRFDEGTFENRLLELIQLPQESKPVQRAAMETQLARAREGYRLLLTRDPLIAQSAANGPAVSPRPLIEDPKAIAMTPRTALLLTRHSEAVGRWARSLKGTADNPQREASVRAKARETLEAVLREFPIPNRDMLVQAP